MDKYEEFQESLDTLLDFSSSQPESLTRMGKEQQAFFNRYMETRGTVAQILKDMVQQEECAAHRLAAMEEKKLLQSKKMESLDEQLRQCTAKNQLSDSELQYLRSEMERLRSPDNELATLQKEVEEDTTEVIPSTIHVVKLYHAITRIKWEYNTKPHILKGAHYGQDLATPIHIDTSVKSQSDIADQLWSLVGDDCLIAPPPEEKQSMI
ncbi:kinetochore protein Spc24 isoform X2 [Vanacampus margaritifer]